MSFASETKDFAQNPLKITEAVISLELTLDVSANVGRSSFRSLVAYITIWPVLHMGYSSSSVEFLQSWRTANS